MKKTQMVQIPTGFVCVSVDDYAALKITVHQLKDEVLESSRNNAKLVRELNEAEKRVEVAENSIKELQRKLDDKQDVVGYWYNKAKEFEEKANAVSETEG